MLFFEVSKLNLKLANIDSVSQNSYLYLSAFHTDEIPY